MRLFDGAGSPLGDELLLVVPPGEWRQLNDVLEGVGHDSGEAAYATVTVSGDQAWVYASVIDQESGDPTTVTVQAVAAPAGDGGRPKTTASFMGPCSTKPRSAHSRSRRRRWARSPPRRCRRGRRCRCRR